MQKSIVQIYKDTWNKFIITGFGGRMIDQLRIAVNIVLRMLHLADSRFLDKEIIVELVNRLSA
jgi:hypothetical protein